MGNLCIAGGTINSTATLESIFEFLILKKKKYNGLPRLNQQVCAYILLLEE